MRDVIDRVLDEACGRFFAYREDHGTPPTRLYVSPDAYAAIVRTRERDLVRQLPVMVCDLDVEVDPVLAGAEVRVG